MKISQLVLIGLAASLLVGCALLESPADRALRASPNYRAGYSDGCTTATNQGTDMGRDSTVRDDELFRADKAYRAGWSSGFGACRTAAPSGGAASDGGPIPERNPGNGGIGM